MVAERDAVAIAKVASPVVVLAVIVSEAAVVAATASVDDIDAAKLLA